jgi:hypothetical protein
MKVVITVPRLRWHKDSMQSYLDVRYTYFKFEFKVQRANIVDQYFYYNKTWPKHVKRRIK